MLILAIATLGLCFAIATLGLCAGLIHFCLLFIFSRKLRSLLKMQLRFCQFVDNWTLRMVIEKHH